MLALHDLLAIGRCSGVCTQYSGVCQRQDEAGVVLGPSIFFLQLLDTGGECFRGSQGAVQRDSFGEEKFLLQEIRYQDQKNEECLSDFPMGHVGRCCVCVCVCIYLTAEGPCL